MRTLDSFEVSLAQIDDSANPGQLPREERDRVPAIVKRLLEMCLNDFVAVFFVQRYRNLLCSKLKFLLRHRALSSPEISESLSATLSEQYLVYVSKYKIRDVYLLKEVHLMKSLLSPPKSALLESGVVLFAQIFLQILANNRNNFSKKRFKIFLVERVPTVVSKLFLHASTQQSFYRNVLRLVLQNQRNLRIRNDIKYCLFLMASDCLELSDIFDLLCADFEQFMPAGFVLKFFLITKKSISPELSQKFLRVCFLDVGTAAPRQRNILVMNPQRSIISDILQNPFSALIMTILFRCFYFARRLVADLVLTSAALKSMAQQGRLIVEIERVFHYLLSVLRLPCYFTDFQFAQLLKLVLCLIPQNDLFFLIRKRLKFMRHMHFDGGLLCVEKMEQERLSYMNYRAGCVFFRDAPLALS